MPSWDSEASDALWSTACGQSRWLEPTEELEKLIRSTSDQDIWNMRSANRKALIDFTRKRLALQLAVAGSPLEEIENAKNLFDPHTLTLGFARRFATYKRPNMLLHDPDRLAKILSHAQRPVQLIIAGKAHPKDLPGQTMIQQWNDFIRNKGLNTHVVFLSDYNILLSEQLVQGVDVWINTPRRPWEACGTSGMKVLVNGGLNLSELDGWWAEAYTPEVGWSIGDGNEHGEDPTWDSIEANALYDLLENEVIPCFYTRNSEGLPTPWIAKIRESMATLTPRFASNRTVREYTEKYYLPAAQKYHDRAANKGALGKQIVDWQKGVALNWPMIRFLDMKIETNNGQHTFEVRIYLNGLEASFIKVELYAMGGDHQQMTFDRILPGDPKTAVFHASVPSARHAEDYTPRIMPYLNGVNIPLEMNQILWQR